MKKLYGVLNWRPTCAPTCELLLTELADQVHAYKRRTGA